MPLFYAGANGGVSTSANRGHDFQAVAGGHLRLRIATPWNDFAVALDRDPLAFEVQRADQIGDGRWPGIETLRLSVDYQVHGADLTRAGRRWRLLPIAAHRLAQEAHLLFERHAHRAHGEVPLEFPAFDGRQLAIPHLRNQVRGALAGNEMTDQSFE
jgi:hypothetical protein